MCSSLTSEMTSLTLKNGTGKLKRANHLEQDILMRIFWKFWGILFTTGLKLLVAE
jgi:hypothetical protein